MKIEGNTYLSYLLPLYLNDKTRKPELVRGEIISYSRSEKNGPQVTNSASFSCSFLFESLGGCITFRQKENKQIAIAMLWNNNPRWSIQMQELEFRGVEAENNLHEFPYLKVISPPAAWWHGPSFIGMSIFNALVWYIQPSPKQLSTLILEPLHFWHLL